MSPIGRPVQLRLDYTPSPRRRRTLAKITEARYTAAATEVAVLLDQLDAARERFTAVSRARADMTRGVR